MIIANLINPLHSAFAAFEDIYSALPVSIRGLILIVSLLFGFNALFSIFRG